MTTIAPHFHRNSWPYVHKIFSAQGSVQKEFWMSPAIIPSPFLPLLETLTCQIFSWWLISRWYGPMSFRVSNIVAWYKKLPALVLISNNIFLQTLSLVYNIGKYLISLNSDIFLIIAPYQRILLFILSVIIAFMVMLFTLIPNFFQWFILLLHQLWDRFVMIALGILYLSSA